MPEEAPSPEDQPINAPEASEEFSDQPGADNAEAALADFDYSGIPDDQRAEVEKRIKGFQASYTRAMQEFPGRLETAKEEAQREAFEALQQNPALLKELLDEEQALQAFGYRAEQEEEFLDPEEQLAREVQELRAWKENQEQTAYQSQQQQEQGAIEDQLLDTIVDDIQAYEERTGIEFEDEDYKKIRDLALANPDQRGVPNTKGALDYLENMATQRHQTWKQAMLKKGPRVPGQGPTGSKAADTSTEEGRRQVAMAAAEEAIATGASE